MRVVRLGNGAPPLLYFLFGIFLFCFVLLFLLSLLLGHVSLLTWYILFRPDGVRFVAPAGTTEFVKRWNPIAGDIVSFKHNGFLVGSKQPKFPVLFRGRPELSWEDIVKNSPASRKPLLTGTPPFFSPSFLYSMSFCFSFILIVFFVIFFLSSVFFSVFVFVSLS